MILKKDWRKKYISLALLITAVYFLAVWKWIGFSYAINDDVNMRDIVSGAYTGTPDGHLIFMLYPLGFALKSLYQLWPGIEWYGIMMVGCHALAMWVMLSAILLYYDRKKNRWSYLRRKADIGKQSAALFSDQNQNDSRAYLLRKLFLAVMAYLFCYTVLWLPQAARVQFSTCAASLGAAALFWYGMGPGGTDGRRLWEDVVTAALAVCCLCVRIEVFCITGAFAVLLFLYKEKKEGIFKGLRLVLLTGTLCLAAFAADRMAYGSREWKDYLSYNQSRSNVYDFYEVPAYEENQDLYEELGLSKDTVQAISEANMLADDSVSQETFRQLDKLTGLRYRQQFSASARLRKGLRLVGESFSPSIYGYLSGTAVFLWLALMGMLIRQNGAFVYRQVGTTVENRDRKKWAGLIFWMGAVCLQGVLWLALGYGGRLPERVGYCLHLCGFVTALMLCKMTWDRPGEKYIPQNCSTVAEVFSEQNFVLGDRIQRKSGRFHVWDRVLFFGIAALLSWGSFVRTAEAAKNGQDARRMAELIETYCLEHPDNFYFADVYSLSAHTGRVYFTNSRPEGQDVNYMRMGDWMAFSPLAREKLNRHGIDSVTESLATDDSVFLLTRDDNPMEYLRRICADRFGSTVWHVEDVLNCGEFHIYVYRIGIQKERVLDYQSFEKVQANVNPTEGILAADGDVSTRWNSGEPQRAGMALDIVLDQVYPVTGFQLELFFYEDHPRRLKIFTSEDGENWTERQASSAGQVEFIFSSPVSCKNIRLMLEDAEDEERWNWSVYEILVFAEEA